METLQSIIGAVFIFSIAFWIAEKGMELAVGNRISSELRFMMGICIFVILLFGSLALLFGEPLGVSIKMLILLVGMIIGYFSSSFISEKLVELISRKKVKIGSGGEAISFVITILLYLGSIWALVGIIN